MDMELSLRYRLWRLRRAADPSAGFSRALEATLRGKTGHPLWWLPLGRIAAAMTSLTLLGASGASVYAYSSDAVTPDHPLYGLRTAVEQAELKVSFGAQSRQAVLDKQRARHERALELLRLRSAK